MARVLTCAPLIALPSFSPGPDKEAFHRYLMDFRAVDDDAQLLDALAECNDVLPSQYARLLFLPPGATYREATRLLLQSWQPSQNALE